MLLLFISVTSVLMVAAVINRMRVQPVRMIWYRRGVFSGLGWSTLFLFIFVGAIIYAGVLEQRFYLVLGLGYLIGGVCWCVAMRLSSATIITDFAVIRNTSTCGNVLCWNQVADFFVHDKGHVLQYTFLYTNNEGTHARFEVEVPRAYHRFFNRMVYRCVERKKSFMPAQAYG